jgi:hypothetical protein
MNSRCRIRFLTSAVAVVLVATAILPHGPASDDEKQPVEPLLQQWEKDIRTRLEEDAKLKALAAKHPLVVLHSRARYAGGDYKRSAYSFIYESADEANHRNNVQVLFHNGGNPNTFAFNMVVGQQNLVVDLGEVDFGKDPEPAKISIDQPGVFSGEGKAVDGHVYLERVRDDRGNNFYVLFQIVAVDKESRYMAFLWRKLPGGKIIKEQAGVLSPNPSPQPTAAAMLVWPSPERHTVVIFSSHRCPPIRLADVNDTRSAKLLAFAFCQPYDAAKSSAIR